MVNYNTNRAGGGLLLGSCLVLDGCFSLGNTVGETSFEHLLMVLWFLSTFVYFLVSCNEVTDMSVPCITKFVGVEGKHVGNKVVLAVFGDTIR